MFECKISKEIAASVGGNSLSQRGLVNIDSNGVECDNTIAQSTAERGHSS